MLSRIWSWALMVLCLCLVVGCKSSEPPVQNTQVDPFIDPSIIQYEYIDAIAAVEGKMLIDKTGRVQVLHIVGADQTNRFTADTMLTEQQREQLNRAFQGWKEHKAQYPAYFGPIFAITFEGYTVGAADSESVVPTLRRVKTLLDSIAIAALRAAPPPVVETKPAAPEPIVYILNSDVEYQYTFTMDSGPVVRRKITVSREEGLLKMREETSGTEPAAPPLDVKIHLTSNQLITLASTLRYLPEGDQRFPGLPDGPYFMIKYEGRQIVSGGLPTTPSAVKSAQLLLEDYAMDAKRFPEEN